MTDETTLAISSPPAAIAPPPTTPVLTPTKKLSNGGGILAMPRSRQGSSSSNQSTPTKGSRPSFLLSTFPSRQSSRSSSNGNSSGAPATPTRTVPTASELKEHLQPASRFAFAKLVITVLRLDFHRPDDASVTKFCSEAVDLIIRHCALPRGTNETLRQVLATGEGLGDIAELITVIKEDPYIAEHSMLLLIGSVLTMVVEKGNYDARYRVMLRHLSALLGVCWDAFEEVEDTLTHLMINDQYIESQLELSEHCREGGSAESREKNARLKKIKRYAMIGAAGGVGGVLIGLTGGLAAPFIAAGAGVVIGTGAAAGIATTAGAAVLGSAFGVAGAGLAGYKMNKRVGAIDEFEVETLSDENSLHVVLCVSGWIDDASPNAFRSQWRHLWMSKEQYTLRYESKYLLELGKAIDYLMSFAVSYAIQHTLMETALAGLIAAVAWPVALLSASSVLDNPWNVCVARSKEVGEHLAELLLTRQHGKRPLTLIGFSLGARVIYHCLLEMSKRPDCHGIIEDVVLLGTPVSASPKQWKQICTVVGGRVINGYCNTDWLLRFLYRAMSVQFTIAGTGPVDNKEEKKIVNFNLSHIVKGHMDYSKKLTEVLDAVGVKVTPRSANSTENLHKYEQEQEEMISKEPTSTSDSPLSSPTKE